MTSFIIVILFNLYYVKLFTWKGYLSRWNPNHRDRYFTVFLYFYMAWGIANLIFEFVKH